MNHPIHRIWHHVTSYSTQKVLQGTRFENVQEINLKSPEGLMARTKTDFQESLDGRVKCFHKCDLSGECTNSKAKIAGGDPGYCKNQL